MTESKLRVLVVEDNPGDRVYLHRLLDSFEEVQFATGNAATLQSALEFLQTSATSVVLLDLNLPDSRGLDTLRAVRNCSKSVVVLVITGIEDRQLAVDALAAGADDYLAKGHFDAQALGRSILRAVHNHGRERTA